MELTYKLLHGDCLEVMKSMPDCSVDAVVTDPPYGLKFMGKEWDHGVPGKEFWIEALRVSKPGSHLLAFGGDRTHHRLMVAIEDAGWELRTCVYWVFGSGFPKSADISKALDKSAGAEREVVGTDCSPENTSGASPGTGWFNDGGLADITAPSTDAAKQWEGWGTALKPAVEIIVMARKPLIGTVAQNVVKYGTGALNIDGCRVPTEDPLGGGAEKKETVCSTNHEGWDRPWKHDDDAREAHAGRVRQHVETAERLGRWPANLIHDSSEEVLSCFPQAPGQIADASTNSTSRKTQNVYGDMKRGNGRDGEASADSENAGDVGFKMKPGTRRLDSGSAARFFKTATFTDEERRLIYCPKASRADRDDGCGELEAKPADSTYGDGLNTATKIRTEEQSSSGVTRDLRRNTHATVKPTALMQYLCRLVTPPGGTILDPFCGSGSTGRGAIAENFSFIGIDKCEEYIEIARCRIRAISPLFAQEVK